MSHGAIIRDVFDRVPALDALRGVARLNAEDALRNAFDDVLDEYRNDCEAVLVTGGAPEPDR